MRHFGTPAGEFDRALPLEGMCWKCSANVLLMVGHMGRQHTRKRSEGGRLSHKARSWMRAQVPAARFATPEPNFRSEACHAEPGPASDLGGQDELLSSTAPLRARRKSRWPLSDGRGWPRRKIGPGQSGISSGGNVMKSVPVLAWSHRVLVSLPAHRRGPRWWQMVRALQADDPVDVHPRAMGPRLHFRSTGWRRSLRSWRAWGETLAYPQCSLPVPARAMVRRRRRHRIEPSAKSSSTSRTSVVGHPTQPESASVAVQPATATAPTPCATTRATGRGTPKGAPIEPDGSLGRALSAARASGPAPPQAPSARTEAELVEFDKGQGLPGKEAAEEKPAAPAAAASEGQNFRDRQWAGLSKKELEEACSERGLGKKGSKEDLVQKLIIFHQERRRRQRSDCAHVGTRKFEVVLTHACTTRQISKRR